MRTIPLAALLAASLLLPDVAHAQSFEDKIVAMQQLVDDRMPGADFGIDVAIDGDYAVVGAFLDDEAGPSMGAAYLYAWDPTACEWINVDKMLPHLQPGVVGGTVNGWFGKSVAIHRDWIAIGAPQETSSGLVHAGAVHIFRIVGNQTVFIQRLLPFDNTLGPDEEMFANFGWDVDLHRRRLVAGAPFEDEDANGQNALFNNSAGAAYLYRRQGGSYQFETKLVAQTRKFNDLFGYSVAIFKRLVAVGARLEDEDANDDPASTQESAGSAHVFRRIGGTWTFQQKLVAPDRDPLDEFGLSIDLRGRFLVVGAPIDEHGVGNQPALIGAGSAYVFRRNGNTWSFDQKLVAPDRAAGDGYGRTVGVDKKRVVVGAPYQDLDAQGGSFKSSAGAAYLYRRQGGAWNTVGKVVAPDRAFGDLFGETVAISGDRFIVGAPEEDEDDAAVPGNTLVSAGSAYTFDVDDLTATLQPVPPVDLCAWDGQPIQLVGQGNGGNCGYVGPGVDPVTGLFDPAQAGGAGTYQVSYVCCGGPQATQTIEVLGGGWHQFTENGAGREIGNDVATDAAGNVYLTGLFTDETDFHGGAGTTVQAVAGGANMVPHAFVAKYDACGGLLWLTHALQNAADTFSTGDGIAVDEQNDAVYVVGNFADAVLMDGGFGDQGASAGPASTFAAGTQGFVARLDLFDGRIEFLDPVVDGATTRLTGVAADPATGEIFVGGYSSDVGDADGFVRKYAPAPNALGAALWQIDSGAAPGNAYVRDLDYDAGGDAIWLVGEFDQQLSYTYGGTVLNSANGGDLVAYVARYTDGLLPTADFLESGNAQSGPMSGRGVAVDDATGAAWLTGTFSGDLVDVFGVPGDTLPNNATQNAWITAMDAAGNPLWPASQQVEAGFGDALGADVATDGSHVYLTGMHTDDALFTSVNPQLLPYTSANQQQNIYVARYDAATGQVDWTNGTVGGAGIETHFVQAITTDAAGHAFLTGGFLGQMSYQNGAPASGALNASGAVPFDMCLLRVDAASGALE